jgi:hypothetical protein
MKPPSRDRSPGLAEQQRLADVDRARVVGGMRHAQQRSPCVEIRLSEPSRIAMLAYN